MNGKKNDHRSATPMHSVQLTQTRDSITGIATKTRTIEWSIGVGTVGISVAVVSKIIASFWYSIRETLIHISRKKEIALFKLLFLQFVKTFNTIKTIWDLQNKFFCGRQRTLPTITRIRLTFFLVTKEKRWVKISETGVNTRKRALTRWKNLRGTISLQ